ncbi:MAG: hypothetical protein SGBAC_008550 [Bacillariaceae sp.]
MSEPDELYTLRAQYWLGHYALALDEAKSIMRRPMSPALKAEREEFSLRCYLALGQYDKVISASPDTQGIKALQLAAQYESSASEAKPAIVQQLQTMLGDGVSASVQLTAAHVFLMEGMKKEALQCVHQGATMEQVGCLIQIYLQLDRIDLAQQQLSALKRADEEAVLTQLAGVQIALATGSSMATEAIHTLNQMSEQYGPSIFLLNLMACACLQAGNYPGAEQRLMQARQEFSANDADTLANLIVAYQYQQKPTAPLVEELKSNYPNHFLAKGLATVEGAFEREAIKYKA